MGLAAGGVRQATEVATERVAAMSIASTPRRHHSSCGTRRCRCLFMARVESRRGAIVVMAAVLLIILLAMVAFAVDSGYMLTVRTELQRAADAGAIAGAAALIEGVPAAEQEAI